MKIYTKQGDAGQTGLVGGQRVAKDVVRIEAYGTLDELSATLGMVAALPGADSLIEMLRQIQCDLFVMGAQLATPATVKSSAERISASHVDRLEGWIDQHESTLPPLRHFVLPGGNPVAAHLHFARVVCRRAERRAVTLGSLESIGDQSIPYLNRLSDLLFVLARSANSAAGIEDIRWISDSGASDDSTSS
jgi:cob(I)alamin adenosyltransferase